MDLQGDPVKGESPLLVSLASFCLEHSLLQQILPTGRVPPQLAIWDIPIHAGLPWSWFMFMFIMLNFTLTESFTALQRQKQADL